ncbi:hypothetical protein LYSHEL_22020 [Lysobacter helvus]|uniref:DUF1579 domain-containing protein n=2 Tax=Lysobacteraceae TaxID=32033 RepID=A0ABM7Q760_9GAMM|nr:MULTISPECIES: hypothetical protein [Lysobacter]BCT93179.1 hypothetical protein LYSCAS_22030 [Lysobacter caseinilyticus]BCT96331.1 hypothetical protein LYSHEL_22020 [Lysobacter helvus]
MFEELVSRSPHPSLGAHAETYGRLIGKWRGTYCDPHPDGEETGPLEVCFAWVLDGRAVQDVWSAPAGVPEEVSPYRRRMHGTTLRVFDPSAEVWRVDWWNPPRGVHCRLVGRRTEEGIVQMGYWDDRPQRWRFLDIARNSFTWQAHCLEDDGRTWRLQTEFRLDRVLE